MHVKHEVDVALADRGRVWHEANLVRANADTGEITATVDEPSPHGIEPKTTLFVFEQNDKEKGGTYLGEFTVSAAKDGDKQIKMLPSLALSQGELTGNLSQPRPLGFVQMSTTGVDEPPCPLRLARKSRRTDQRRISARTCSPSI